MRLFVGIELAGRAREAVLEVHQKLTEVLPKQGVRFVRPEKLHLTLAFLGQVEESSVEQLKEALSGLSELPRFELVTTEVGAFPDMRRPKVLWVGLDGDLSALNTLAAATASAAKPFAPELDEKPFSPHITLARISPGSKEVGRLVHNLRFEECRAVLAVESATLFHSAADGSYIPLMRQPLA